MLRDRFNCTSYFEVVIAVVDSLDTLLSHIVNSYLVLLIQNRKVIHGRDRQPHNYLPLSLVNRQGWRGVSDLTLNTHSYEIFKRQIHIK